MTRVLEPTLPRFVRHLRPRNPDGTFRKLDRGTSSNRSAGSAPPALSEKPKRSKFMRIIMAILHEVREILWPSDSEELGIKRGYLDDRDRI